MPAPLTHERELTEAVDLCMPDGGLLNPAARGWSRHPLHRGNMRRAWGRNKRWDYWAIQSDAVIVAVTFADIDYLGLVSIDWIDLRSGRSGRRVAARPASRGVSLPQRPGTEPLRFSNRGLTVEVSDTDDATRLLASWTEKGRGACHLDVSVGARQQDSLNVVVPWSPKRFQFTSKHQARPAVGSLHLGEERFTFGGTDPNDDELEAWGILDVGRGRWPYKMRWNWGGASGRATDGGPLVGVQIGAKWTDGTGATENGVIVDGSLVKIGEELTWDYSWEEPLAPWHVHGGCGLDITLTPVYDRHSRTTAGVLSMEVHQVFGRWSGVVPDGRGGTLAVDRIQGFAEEARNRW